MITCPECGSSDVYFKHNFEVCQNAEGEFVIDSEQLNYALSEENIDDECFVCRICSNIFTSHNRATKFYTISVSKLCYGMATVQADSPEDAESKFFNGEVEVDYFDSEITDVLVE